MKNLIVLFISIFIAAKAHALITIEDKNLQTRDLYTELGVTRFDALVDITKAYRRLARKYHPDVSTEPDAEAKFKQISEVYEFLKDPEKRAFYDRLRQALRERVERARANANRPRTNDVYRDGANFARYNAPDFTNDFVAQRRPSPPPAEPRPSTPAPPAGEFDLSTLDGVATWALTQTRAQTFDVFKFVDFAGEALPGVSERDILLRVSDLSQTITPISNKELGASALQLLQARSKFQQFKNECDSIMRHTNPQTRREF